MRLAKWITLWEGNFQFKYSSSIRGVLWTNYRCLPTKRIGLIILDINIFMRIFHKVSILFPYSI
jgi:hypothetical protein